MNRAPHTAQRNGLSRIWLGLLALAVCCVAAAQTSPLPQGPSAELVRSAVKNEVAAADNTVIKHLFCSRKQTPKGSQTKLYVETNDSIAAMLIAVNDQAINADQ